MAIFHLTAKVISRGKGHSAVAAAAYRSRSCLEDERTGETCDFSRKAGELLFEGIFAPKDAPAWARDRAQLWNHVEAIEKRRDAQLAREFEIALPHELTLDQQRFAVQDWVRDNFTRRGLIADVVIHAPGQGGDERNTHAHIMVVMRKLDGSEFAAKKERAADMAERKAELEQLRQSWERTGNRHLERHGHAPTLDRRTLLEQGIDRPPTVHLGKEATALERKGVETDLGDLNRAIGTLPVIDLAAERLRRQRQDETRAGGQPQPLPPGRDDQIEAEPNSWGRASVATTNAGLVAQQEEALQRFAQNSRQMQQRQAKPPAPDESADPRGKDGLLAALEKMIRGDKPAPAQPDAAAATERESLLDRLGARPTEETQHPDQKSERDTGRSGRGRSR